MPGSALLVMDYQVGIVQRFGEDAGLLDRVAQAIRAARDVEVPVIFVRVAFRGTYPEVSATNRRFSALMRAGGMDEAAPATQIHPSLASQLDDVVVTKRRVSAFAGSDLDVVLRAAQVDTLVLAGIATSGVVLSTFTAAADRDFSLVVLADACADRDAEVHRVLIDRVFVAQADVLTVDQWTAQLKG